MKKLKIVLINNLYTPNIIGGAERSVQSLAEALVRTGHDVTVLCLDHTNHVKIINGVRVIYLKVFKWFWPFTYKRNKLLKYLWQLMDCYNFVMERRLFKILCKENFDIVNTHNLAGFSVSAWTAVNKLEVPLIHTIRDYYLICPRSSMYTGGCNCNKQCNLCKISTYYKFKLSSRIKSTICVSSFVSDKHSYYGYLSNSCFHVIHNSYDKKSSNLRTIKAKKLVFGYIGRLNQNKGIEYLLQVFKSDKTISGARLLVAGEGNPDFIQQLKQKSTGTDVVFLGDTPPEHFFGMVDVLVAPSLWNEPLGRIIFEAYAHGIPVIASIRGGIPEIVDHGKTGFLFDPDNPSSLIKTMQKICLHPELALEMAPNCIEKSKEFLPETIAHQYLQVYYKALGYESNGPGVVYDTSTTEARLKLNVSRQ